MDSPGLSEAEGFARVGESTTERAQRAKEVDSPGFEPSARRSGPAASLAEGSNPGESIRATEFYEGARMGEPGFERLDRRSPRSEG